MFWGTERSKHLLKVTQLIQVVFVGQSDLEAHSLGPCHTAVTPIWGLALESCWGEI